MARSVFPVRRCTIVRTFVDSNVLIYAHDADAGSKQRIAADQLRDLWKSGTGLLSTQVLQEFYVNVTRKIGVPLGGAAAREVVRDYAAWVESSITAATIVRASEISEVWQISFWDSLVQNSFSPISFWTGCDRSGPPPPEWIATGSPCSAMFEHLPCHGRRLHAGRCLGQDTRTPWWTSFFDGYQHHYISMGWTVENRTKEIV